MGARKGVWAIGEYGCQKREERGERRKEKERKKGDKDIEGGRRTRERPVVGLEAWMAVDVFID